MRLLFLLSLLALSASGGVSAQSEDPIPPWRYDPIEVGNVRAYTRMGATAVHWRTDSPAALTLDGIRWVIRRTHQFQFDLSGPEPMWTRAESRRLVRFDTAAANVAVRSGVGGRDHLYPCRLDLPIPVENPEACPGEGEGASYSVWPEATVHVGAESFVRTVRAFDGVVPGPELAAGIGDVGGPTEESGPVRLDYAVVGGDSLASRSEGFPATDIDPTPGWQYYPLAVGNEWQYERTNRFGQVDEITRRTVTGTVEVEGQTFYIERHERAAPGDAAWTLDRTSEVRYDTLLAHVVTPAGYTLTPCPFDEPVFSFESGDPPVVCERDQMIATLGEAVTLDSHDGPFETRSKSFVSLFADTGARSYIAGVGVGGMGGFVEPNVEIRLLYAAVRQDDGSLLVVGSPYPVASEAATEAGGLTLSAVPSPTSGTLTLRLGGTVAEVVTVDAFDALGRQVWTQEGAGRQSVSVDASGWVPGLYVVRARTGGRVVTATVIRR